MLSTIPHDFRRTLTGGEYKTHFKQYEALRDRYIATAIQGIDQAHREELLPQISAALRMSLSVATLAETQKISQILKNFAKAYLKQYDLSQKPIPLSATNHHRLLVCIFLNELRLGATENGWLIHQHHDYNDPVIAKHQRSLSVDLLDALLDFAQINIFSATLLSASPSEWPYKVQAYQMPLKYILGCLQRLDQSPALAALDLSMLEKAYIGYSLEIGHLAIQTQHFDDAKIILDGLQQMLQRIPDGYQDARTQCQQWLEEFWPKTLAPISNTQGLAPPPSRTETNRRKKENQQLNTWIKTANDLPREPDSIARLIHIQTLLTAKMSERPVFLQKKQMLNELICQKIDAIQQQTAQVAITQSSPPAQELNITINAVLSPILMSENALSQLSDNETALQKSLDQANHVSNRPQQPPSSTNLPEEASASLRHTKLEASDTAPLKPLVSTAAAKKAARREIRQQQLEELNSLERQIRALSQSELDAQLVLTQSTADLSLKTRHEKSPIVLQRIAEITALITEKKAQFAARHTSAPSVSVEDGRLEADDSAHTSFESISTQDIESSEVILPLSPACLALPHYSYVINQLTKMAQDLNIDVYLFGSAIYKTHPNDLDLLLPYKNANALITLLLKQDAQIHCSYQKKNRHIVQVKWHDVKLDINLSHKTWQQHASQLDFTVGAAYYHLRTQHTTALHLDTLDHITNKVLHCAQAHGSVAMLRQDPSIVFRAIRIAQQEGYRWSQEFSIAIETLAQQATNPFLHLNPNKLYQEIERLFQHGQAVANLQWLIQLKLFNRVFGRVSQLSDIQRDKALFIARTAALSCDIYKQPPSFMFYAIHWTWLIQNPIADAHAIAGQAVPRIELQMGHAPQWNTRIHHYNLQLLQRYAMDYDYRMACITHYAPQTNYHQPPCRASRQGYAHIHKKRRAIYAPRERLYIKKEL